MHCVLRTVGLTVLQRTAIVALCLIAAAAESRAETNPHPIAIPAIGTAGPASPYPSRIVVNSLGGPASRGYISVTLHGVTHPCIDELAVFLVHNDAAGLVLMSNAGGCRPLDGTDLYITNGAIPLPAGGPLGPPYGDFLQIAPSNYLPLPVFPAPAPSPKTEHGLPDDPVIVDGTWDLYIVDTRASNRGVVAAGWSLNYSPFAQVRSSQEDVAVPGAGTSGPAAHYPIEFDLTGASPTTLVSDVAVLLAFQHSRPDDLRVVLQSPQGTPCRPAR
jgi:hypothetical protein